jgi:hypothetical protein
MEFERLLRRLIECRIEFVLVGGFAAVVYGASLVTQDLDISLKFSRENLDRLDAALRDLHPVHRLTPNELPLEITDANWASLKNLYLRTDWGILDCLGEIAGLGDYSRVVEQSELVEFPFGSYRILTMDGLIRAKEAMGREHDRRAVTQLKIIQSRNQPR